MMKTQYLLYNLTDTDGYKGKERKNMRNLNIYHKLAKVKESLDGKVTKNSVANMGKFKYSFINLEKLLDLVEPLFREYQLYLCFPCAADQQGCVIVDLEESGSTVDSYCEMAITKDFQDSGKQMTYLRRYLLLGLLGLQASEDDDGAGSRGGSVQRRTKPVDVKKMTASAPPKGNPLADKAQETETKEHFKIFLSSHAKRLKAQSEAEKKVFSEVLKNKCKEFGLKESQAVELIKKG